MIATMGRTPSTHPCGCFHPLSMEAKFLISSISCLLIFICSPYFFYLMCITLVKHSYFVVFVLFDACSTFYAFPFFCVVNCFFIYPLAPTPFFFG